MLSPLAAFSDRSVGRLVDEEPDALRTCYQRDRDRIVHCKAFRRLSHKTQVFLAPEGDHYRTRLTHTLEVAQIARSVAASLRLNEDLTEAIALGHDLGHTPFGHTGEGALSRAIARWRGIDPESDEGRRLFRHNEQSVRVVDLLEKDGRGLNLSREVVDGLGTSSSQRISTMVSDLVATSSERGDIAMSDPVWEAMMELRSWLFHNVYTQSDAKVEEPKANGLVERLFLHYIGHMDEVPAEYRMHDGDTPEVQVADYISGMTDRYAIRDYERLFLPRAWRR